MWSSTIRIRIYHLFLAKNSHSVHNYGGTFAQNAGWYSWSTALFWSCDFLTSFSLFKASQRPSHCCKWPQSWCVQMPILQLTISGSSDPLESQLLALGLLAPRLIVLVCIVRSIHWWATRLVPGNNHEVIQQSPSAHQGLCSHNNLHRFFTGTTLCHICLK